MGRPSDYRPEFSKHCPDPLKPVEGCRHAICHMAGGKSKETFAAKIGQHRDTLYAWAEEREEFSDAIKRGEALSLLWWESLMQSGTAGQLRAVSSEEYGKDGKVLKRKYRSANFHPVGAIFTMKNRFPRLYRDRIDLRHEAGDIHDDLTNMTMDELVAESDRLNAEIKRARKK